VDTSRSPAEIHREQLARLSKFEPVYYQVKKGEFWFKLGGEWAPIKKGDLTKMHFRKRGLRNVPFVEPDGSYNFNEVDWPIWNAQENNKVKYAGSIAGHRCGVEIVGTSRVLITDECHPEIWSPNIGKKLPHPKWFIESIDQLLPLQYGVDQAELFKFWLGIALESLVNQTFVQGQLMVLAGDAGCGKSAAQQIITDILGRREFPPMQSWLDGGKFNSGLASAEHWKIEDPESTTDMKTRYKVGQKIKKAVINVMYEIEGKGVDALSLPLFRRSSFSCNRDTVSLAAMPPLANGLADKTTMLSCEPADFGPDVAFVKAKIEKERAQIHSYLLRNYCAAKVPEEWRIGFNGKPDRMKIRAWQHPDLLEMLAAISPEAKLLQMIDETLFDPIDSEDKKKAIFKAPIIGPAREIESRIKKDGKYSENQLERVFSSVSACGSLLDHLSRSFPERVKIEKAAKQNSGKVIWRINPPAKENNEQEDK